ncbi:related to cell wall protein YGR189c [Phialocephala subalpina]|uniref:chitinase n=1 Tax=Phialocephala subalpina TaxID=576137 RepID=A0A1L7XYW5_9HELO|nr:related to cell wall protein YGR189c [Phialocephala subalpina]
MQLSLSLLVGAAALVAPVFAQTWTTCNPMNETCPNDPALGISHNFVFNTSETVTNSFNITAGSLVYGTNGTEFTINKKGDSPTIQSQFYIFWGSVSVVMKAASGQGIISSIVLESDDLDEVDWEFLGGNGTHAETNYFGKGNTTSYDRAIYYPSGSDNRENFHNYTVHWTSDQLQWYIDSNLVRTLPYAAAYNGYNYPQTPMTVRLGIWAGGDSENSNGTIEWAGGLTDYSKGPYTMVVQSAQINDFSTGSAYQWTDKTGSFSSIKAIAGNSTAAETIVKAETPTLSLAQKWSNLPSTTKIAVYAGSGGAAAILLAALTFVCIRQRRAGRKEREDYNAKVEKEREEAFRDQMELREKGLGGWDKGAFEKQGEDALGGWGDPRRSHVPQGYVTDEPTLPKLPSNVMVKEVPSRVNSPAITRSVSPISRHQTPFIVNPVPQSPRGWNGGNQGGMIQDAGNAYSGGYGGNTNFSNNFSRSPSFPLGGSVSPQRGPSNSGYQRF